MDYRPYNYNPYGNEMANVWPMLMNSSWYSGNPPVNSCMVYPGMTRVETLEDIYRVAFPDDPIREWGNKRIEEIDRKYAWLKDKSEGILRTNAPNPMMVTLKE